MPLREYVLSNNKSHYNVGYGFRIRLIKKYGYTNCHFIHYNFSYSLNIEGGVVTLLTFSDDTGNHYYKLLLQNTPQNDVYAINTKDEYQKELCDLLKLIKDKRDNVDNLIEKIIGKD